MRPCNVHECGEDQPDQYRHREANEHSDRGGCQHHHCIAERYASDPSQEVPIYDPVARDDDDARQHGQRDLIERHRQSQCDNYRGRDARNHVSAACLEVEECSRASAAGITPDQARRNVADTLGHQFPIRLMPPTGGGVGLQASQQRHGST